MSYEISFHRDLRGAVERIGGYLNGHAHLDRAFTRGMELHLASDAPRKGLTLQEKQSLTGTLHRGSAYTEESLGERMGLFLEESAKSGVTRVDSFIDVANDIPLGEGLGALRVALDLKKEYERLLDFRVGAYPIFGFKDSDPSRWELFVEAGREADFLGTLPERDDPIYYGNGRDHIGFKEHLRRTLKLALDLDKPIHYHLDQQNSPYEKGVETLLEVIKEEGLAQTLAQKGRDEPFVWAVHAISPSCYPKRRLEKVIGGFLESKLGLIVCPSAALSMRQLAVFTAPIHNSIGKALDFARGGVPIRVGTDNVDDMFLPATSLDVKDETGYLANALRFYDTDILAKFAAGVPLDESEKQSLKEHLAGDESIGNEIKVRIDSLLSRLKGV